MFPRGRPGVALLLLRLSAAATIAVLAWPRLGVFASLWVLALGLLTILSLCLGLLTPIFSLVCCLLEFAALLLTSGTAVPVQALSIMSAIALALLGPGAYSVDARLFGRKVVVIPSSKDAPRL